MTKKILSLIVVLTVMVGCISFGYTVSADSEAYGVEALAHLQNIGVFSQGLEADDVMTRSEFANAVYNMVGNGVVYNTNYIFYDVETSHPHNTAINYCAQNGYMTGSDGWFRPDDSITFIEGMTVVARILNYTEYAKNNGDYTLGYYTTAKNIGLLKNTGIESTNDAMLVGNAAAMFYNALRCNANKLVAVNPLYNQYTDSTQPFSYEVLGLSFAKGVMTSNGDCDITDKDNLGKYTVIVDNTVYSSRLIDNQYKFYIGQEVSLFYDNEGNIVSIVPTGTSTVTNIIRSDFASKSGNVFKYSIDEADYKAKLSQNVVYVKNGKIVVDFKATGFEKSEFSDMTLIDTDADGDCDYVFVNVYDTFVVNSKTTDNVISSISNKSSYDISDDNGKAVYVYDANGNLKTADHIYTDYVVSVIESDNFIYVVYANSRISGKVTCKEDYLVEIDGMEFDIPNGTKTYFKDVSFGDSITVYFDFEGRAIYVVDGYISEMDEPFGFLIKSDFKPGIDKKLVLKILTSEGNIEVFEVGSKFRINGKQYRRTELVDDALFRVQGEVNNTVILYNLNEDGQVISVTFPKTELNYNEDGFIKSYSKEKAQVISNGTLTTSSKKDDGSYFSGYEFINANTAIFIVPENLENEDEFAVTTKTYIPLSTNLIWDTFHFSKYNSYVDVAVIHGEYAHTSFDSSLSVVTYVGKAYDENENEVVSIKAYTNNGETVYTAPVDLSFTEYKYDKLGNKATGTVAVKELKPGDVVRLGTDKMGHIRQGERIYEYNATSYAFKNSTKAGAYATHSLYLKDGYVAFNDKSIFRLADNKDDAMALDGTIFKKQGFIFSSAKIYFVSDSKRGVEVTTGSVGDIVIGDYVIYQGRAGVAKYVVVFKDK